MNREFVAFDLETTGLSPKTDRIIEIGAVRFTCAGEILGELELFVDPSMDIPLAVQRLTGISMRDLEGAPTPREGVAQLADFCDGADLVAHGAGFDMAHCIALLPEAFSARRCFDTLDLARVLLPTAPSHSLPQLSRRLAIEHSKPHRAKPDAAATAGLFTMMAERAAALPATTLAAIRDVVSSGALGEFFGDVVSGDGDATRPSLRPHGSTGDARPVPDTAARWSDPGGPLEDAAAAFLGPDGPLALHDEYELRDEQIAMARAVAQVLDRRQRLLVEAGTGIGKSLAYLVPVILWAARGGGRAVIATQTITLQEQLAARDAPRVLEALAAPVDVAMLKGRHHYISLRRWENFLQRFSRQDEAAVKFALMILVWLTETTTGDRGELHFGALDRDIWRMVQSEADDCLGSACANWRTGRCFMAAARRSAAAAPVVITNHALLLADSELQGRVLSDYQALIVDEGHRLEESATRQLGTRVRGADVDLVLQRVAPARLDHIGEATDAARRLFGEIKGFLGTHLGRDNNANGTCALTAEVRASAGLVTIRKLAEQAATELGAAATHLQSLVVATSQEIDETALAAVSLRGIAAGLRCGRNRLSCTRRRSTWRRHCPMGYSRREQQLC